ncbi:MAG TPA: hypothetical protein VFD42_08210 [Chloroflexota bacterium]|nr:hypothetical protein [Chloroflexota bacterium]
MPYEDREDGGIGMDRQAEIVRRHTAFWRRDPVDRPIGTTWIGSKMPDELYPAARAIPVGRVAPSDVDVESFVADYDRLYELHDAVGDDGFWVESAFYGIPWLEAILGCPVYYSGETFWVEPIVKDWRDAPEIPTPEGRAWLDKLLEFTEALVERAGGRYAIGATLMRGSSDLVAAVRGHMEMIYDLYDNPDALQRLVDAGTEQVIEVNRRQLELIPPYEGGYVCRFYRVWAPERIICTQQDAAASFSPELYRRHLLASDDRVCSAFPYTLMHLHSPTLWPVEQLLELESLSCIEVNYDDNGPRLPEILPMLKRIQEAKPLIIRGGMTDEEIRQIKGELSPRGLLVNMIIPSVEEARRQMELLRA